MQVKRTRTWRAAISQAAELEAEKLFGDTIALSFATGKDSGKTCTARTISVQAKAEKCKIVIWKAYF